MHDWQSLFHVRWKCKWHAVVNPKYRQEVFYGKRMFLLVESRTCGPEGAIENSPAIHRWDSMRE